MTFRAPKYSCTICGKVFRRNKQHYNHVNRAHRNEKRGTNKNQIVTVVESRTLEPQPYIGREYNFVNIPTGMRHLRSGLPLPRLNPNMRCAI